MLILSFGAGFPLQTLYIPRQYSEAEDWKKSDNLRDKVCVCVCVCACVGVKPSG